MKTRNFQELSRAKWFEGKFACLGLDFDFTKFPAGLRESFKDNPIAAFYRFGSDIINANKDIVGFFKPNIAFFERYGDKGAACLRELIQTCNEVAPEVPVIIDAKRNEIDNTNLGYVDSIFDYYGADAVTVNPYLGLKALTPFLGRKDKGIIVLCRTSNVESDQFQVLEVFIDDQLRSEMLSLSPDSAELLKNNATLPMYLIVAHKAKLQNSITGNIGLVTGATYPEDLKPIRKIAGSVPFLLPGIGAQSKTGDLKKDLYAVLDNSFVQPTGNIIINVSRAALYASNGPDYAAKCAEYIVNMNSIINEWRQKNG